MRTIEVHHLKGADQQLITRMWFLDDKDFQKMVVRLTTGAPFITSRRDRYEACRVRANCGNGFEYEYHTDKVTTRILNICTEYALFYGCARKIAERRVWGFAWQFATPEWRQKTILKQMRRASRLLTTK